MFLSKKNQKDFKIKSFFIQSASDRQGFGLPSRFSRPYRKHFDV